MMVHGEDSPAKGGAGRGNLFKGLLRSPVAGTRSQ